ncbi:MAG: transglutaminase domain-containing protein, partial [Actinobacteria bacterium]|nr:transglutaminase domain-containing protein [Actinomycetota bacterium]
MAAAIVAAAFVGGIRESLLERDDSRYVRAVARRVVEEAHATDDRARVIALRDYLRTHVNAVGLPLEGRPFLRAGAADTLRSGKGYCGDVTRAFVVMADAVGIRAQRINLSGTAQHVVAEAHVGAREEVIVDASNPPAIVDLEPLFTVMRRPEFDDYYTLNLKRLRMTWLVTHLKVDLGPLSSWTERPHAVSAFLCFLLAVLVAAAIGLRALVRWLLHRRGWVHVSNQQALAERGLVPVDSPPCST